ncbi:MAG: hypothetical protein ACLFTK_15545 [Anaerolineales bacterium]
MIPKLTFTPHHLAWGIIITSGLISAMLYGAMNTALAETFRMPTDTGYIMAQYAESGWHFTEHASPSTGFSSWLYLLILGLVGLALSAQGLLIATALIGVVLHVGAAWLIYILLIARATPIFSATLLATSYAVSGAFLWGAFSSTAIPLLTFALLGGLYAYQAERYRAALIIAGLLPFVRPEGTLAAWVLLLAIYVMRRGTREQPWSVIYWLWPLVASVAPFLMFALLAGSPWPAEMHVYSYLLDPTLAPAARLDASSQALSGMWQDFATGWSAADGWFLLPLITVPALLGILYSVRTTLARGVVSPGMLIFLWLLGLSAYLATLEHAFDEYKRLQLPLLALIFPLGGWFLGQLERQFDDWSSNKWLFRLIAGAILMLGLYTNVVFLLRYGAQVGHMEAGHVALARWAADNLPPGQRIATAAPGSLAYVGGRAPLDLRGLTTPAYAADYRLGAGALYEALVHDRPGYLIANVNDPRLSPLLDAWAAQEVRRIPSSADEVWVLGPVGPLVALQLDYRGALGVDVLAQPDTIAAVGGAPLRRVVNVADLPSERAADYAAPPAVLPPTRLLTGAYERCLAEPCIIWDGARALESEQFETGGSGPFLVVGRFWAETPVALTAGCEDDSRQTVDLPALDGAWVELMFTDVGSRFCLRGDGVYLSAWYWVYDQPVGLGR